MGHTMEHCREVAVCASEMNLCNCVLGIAELSSVCSASMEAAGSLEAAPGVGGKYPSLTVRNAILLLTNISNMKRNRNTI